MKLLTIHDVNDVRLDDVERGNPGPRDVVVKMKACGICGSDLSYIKMGGIPLPGTKTALGHEASAEVIEVGSEVTGHKVGERVVING
ncbi:MAG: alcohol dehydrogenase catalytic domain-containing protein, partial [Novosphingobium sp.]